MQIWNLNVSRSAVKGIKCWEYLDTKALGGVENVLVACESLLNGQECLGDD